MTQAVDLFVVYKLIKAISTPFDETDAFELGLVDENGKLLRKPRTQAEKEAYSAFDRVVFNIKRILQRVGLDKKYATYAGAIMLMREGVEDMSMNDLERGILHEYNSLQKDTGKSFRLLNNEMTATGAAVAGTGDDPVHWGKPKGGRPKTIGRAISGTQYLKRRNKKSANTISSSYPRGMAKLEGNKAQLGIPANATLSQLEKIRSSETASKETRQRAHWLANMRRGSKK